MKKLGLIENKVQSRLGGTDMEKKIENSKTFEGFRTEFLSVIFHFKNVSVRYLKNQEFLKILKIVREIN